MNWNSVVCLLLATLAFPSLAEEATTGGANSTSQTVKSADTKPARLTTRDFFKNPQIGAAQLSPSGKYIALMVPEGSENRLDIAELATLHYTASYDMMHTGLVGPFEWVNDRQIVWETMIRLGPLDEIYRTGGLMVGRADRSEGRRIGTEEVLLGRIPNSQTDILVGLDKRIYRQNVDSESIKVIADLPYDHPSPTLDHTGKLRAVTGFDKDDFVTSTWDDKEQKWKVLHRSKPEAGYMEPVDFAADDRHLYVASSVNTSTVGLYLMDTETGDSKPLFHDDVVDWSRDIRTPGSREPAGVLYFPDYSAYHFFDDNSATAKAYNDLRHAFPGCNVVITSTTDDGALSIVAVESDRRPEEFYLFDYKQHHLQQLFKSRPWIDQEQMSEVTAFVIKARDGLELHGYLTIPKGHEDKNLPLIVLPHGGPSDRDYWEFNPEVQFLAYHGYAVLQLNFRGSSGYGRDFENAGFGNWGKSMQDDLTDATRWAIQEGIADPKRICIYGANYGAYAALMGVIREPDLYRCAAGLSGPYDLTVQEWLSDTMDTRLGRDYLYAALGKDKDDLRARSPVYNVDRIKVPLLLAHGREDERVPYVNFEKMTSALDKAGKPYETLVKEHEGHGFALESDEVEFNDRLLAFLDRNIGEQAHVEGAAAK